MKRDKFFFVNPTLFNDREWPYKSRYAIGVRLADFRARNQPTFRFQINETMYSIDRTRAFKLGLKYMIPHGTLPNLLPLDEFHTEPSPRRKGQPAVEAPESQETDGRQFLQESLKFNF